MLQKLSLMYLVLGCLGSVLITYPKSKKKEQKVKQNLDSDAILEYSLHKSNNQTTDELRDLVIKTRQNTFNQCQDVKTALKMPTTYLLMLNMFFGFMYGASISSNYKTYGLLLFPDDKFISEVGSFGSLFNGLSRIACGFIFNYFSYKQVHGSLLFLQIVTNTALILINDSKLTFAITIAISYITVGSYFVIFPTLVSNLYGNKHGGRIYGFIAFGDVAANFTQLILMTVLKEYIDMRYIFIIFLGTTFIGFLLMLATPTKLDWKKINYKYSTKSAKEENLIGDAQKT